MSGLSSRLIPLLAAMVDNVFLLRGGTDGRLRSDAPLR